MSYVKPCPRCGSLRPADEVVCLNTFHDQRCNWSLFDVLPVPADAASSTPPTQSSVVLSVVNAAAATANRCRNGHTLEPGEFMCMVCGEPATPNAAPPPREASAAPPAMRVVNGWRIETELAVVSGESDLSIASRESTTTPGERESGVFKHYRRGIEPEASLYPALRALDPDHGLRLLDAGRVEDRAFEVWEYLPLGTLGAIPVHEKADPEFLRQTVREIGGALHGLAQVEIIHRDLKPANVLVRSREPLDLVLADFSTATVSEFDLQLTMTRQTTRYAAPETIAGTCSAASDWWSFGVMLLEMLTQGRGFEGVHERAFLLNLVTRGLRVPDDLPEEWRELLMGLLTRDPSRRWAWAEVERWLKGERGIPNGYAAENATTAGQGEPLRLNGRVWSTPESFALAAADSAAWDEARNILLSGKLATWLQQRGCERDKARAAHVRSFASDLALDEDARLAVSLLALNDNLPLCYRGEIVTPAWVLSHPEIALTWIDSQMPARLRRLDRESWFVRLHERADRVRARVREIHVECDEAQFSAALLATSRTMLEGRWRERRRLFPEAEQPALAAMIERRLLSEEDLIILVSAPLHSFRPADDVLDEAAREAERAQVSMSRDDASRWLDLSRRQILDTLNDRLRNFVRCGREVADQWADDFRQDRRITLARALVLLAIPSDEWREPARQEYVRNVLDFFHRRLVTGLQRGGLVRMTIGRTTARLDLTELAGPSRSAEALLSAVLARQGQPTALDPAPLLNDPQREQRLRRLAQNAAAYRRDTGINALYLGFPFVVLRDARASEGTKPRIAPVLLCPIRIEMPAGSRGSVKLAFDSEREEIRINPALEGLLGGAAVAWREILDDVRGRENLDHQNAIDALSPLAPLAIPPGENGIGSTRLRPLPSPTVRVAPGQIQLHATAVLFHADFSGQTIAEDLKALAMRPIQGTALEVAIRAGVGVSDADSQPPPEIDRYFTADSDPSQQAAVFRARKPPGLVVQGPPGTGKSQTIVNVVCDAIGRGERVLIVCQKMAALEVVRKRLDAEGLGERIFFLKDPVSDRRPALQALREQLEHPVRSASDDDRLRREREGLAQHIEALETELNSAHSALRETPAERPGHLPYRELLDALLAVEQGSQLPVSFHPLGAALRSLDHATAEQLIAEIAPITPLWLEAKFENSPLHCLAYFRTDEGTLADFQRAFDALRMAEARRHEVLRQHARFFDIDTPDPLQRWLAEHEAALRALPPIVSQSLSRWAELFSSGSADEPPTVEQLIPWLEQLDDRLHVMDQWTFDAVLYEKLASRGNGPLKRLAGEALLLATPPRSLVARLNPALWFSRRRVYRWLRAAGVDPDAVDFATLHAAAELELSVRGERPTLQDWRVALGEAMSGSPEPIPVLRATVRRLIEILQPVIAAARRVRACPVQVAADELRHSGDSQSCTAVLDACRASLALWAATQESEKQLEAAAAWFDAEWLAARRRGLDDRTAASDSLEQLAASFPTLPAFQTFRVRARALNAAAFPLLKLLREREDVWQRMPASEVPSEITRTLRREALLAWKAAAEEACPALLIERRELDEKVRLLGDRDAAMREANRRLLAQCSSRVQIAARTRWDDVVMLTGQRARRLREVVDRGDPLGLFQLRPIWMVNPEMTSRLFPLQAGLFDLVIFDEASQLPVECALPALFRARRLVVSGDEKQMPPSRFFGSQLDSDEEEGGDEWLDADDERLDETERERLAQAAGRREVKDCTDLLTLTQNLLPTATLEIHYRSKYRQLIDYSNAAFYAGKLNVPARHPAHVVTRAQPIEVERVNGQYADQKNEAEAARVVARLRQIWQLPPEKRPSVGVVTFNLKQADLIQDKLEEMAEKDDAFREAWEVEQVRTQRGEDMSCFVKNLENVQGDERDWIIFSTTFGRDASGTFRRNFGVLGQHGGERRLNVAVTRAREKMVVITSMPTNEISSWLGAHMRRPPTIPRDFLQAWLRYAEQISSGDFTAASELLRSLYSDTTHARRNGNSATLNSVFEEQVAAFIRECGPNPQTARGDAFGVDFALVHPETQLFGLGVECDAPSHPVLATARARELWRPSVLSASIPKLHRVTSRAWYHDRQAEHERLRNVLRAALSL